MQTPDLTFKDHLHQFSNFRRIQQLIETGTFAEGSRVR
jgi:hypothetical protein